MNKKLLSLSTALLLLGIFVGSVKAFTTTASIQKLPEYTNDNSFYLSCSSLNGSSAQFAYKKEGDSYANFGPAINLATDECKVEVTSSQVNNDQTKYFFKVTVDGSFTDETSTFYDISGPSPVQGYGRDKIADGYFKLFWRNPHDDDFSRVFIYRGEEPGFPADGAHKVVEVGGAKDQEMSWENSGLDPNKTYYYLLRAIDKAGNSSSLVGDTSTTYVTLTPAPQESGSGTSGENIIVPSGDDENGTVLGEESDENMEGSMEGGEMTAEDSDQSETPAYLYVIGGLIVLYLAYFFIFKRNKK